MPFDAKKHRLPEDAYKGRVAVSFTACLQPRRKYFQDIAIVDPHVQVLAEQIRRFECIIPLYCFMPDHLHLILWGQTPRALPKRAMAGFKYASTKILKQQSSDIRWQKGFYDHIFVDNHDFLRTMTYIAENPVRAGLVDDFLEYPFTGSLDCDWRDLLR